MPLENEDSSTSSKHSKRLESLARRLARLGYQQLSQVEKLVDQFEYSEDLVSQDSVCDISAITDRDWPHAPLHRLSGKGTYIVTAGTLHKQHFFCGKERLTFLESQLLSLAKQYDWQIEAWAVFSNHYHFVGHALEDAESLTPFLSHLHAVTAREINRLDKSESRQVWFNFRDTELTYEKSYLARLNYVHQNAVKHGLVQIANQYRWCSAAWFERTAKPSQIKTIYSFKTDQLKIVDEFEVPEVT